jgi:hypothetical protein
MNISRPLDAELSQAMCTFAALQAEWLEHLPPAQQSIIASALEKGCRLAVEFEPLAKAIAFMLFEPGGKVQRLGLLEFVESDANGPR